MKNRVLYPVVFLGFLIITWACYSGNSTHQLLHWDDITYVSANPWVTAPSWQGTKELFSESRLLNWHPITWLSYIPEYYFCGEQASCYKNTNIFLHAFNALLVFWLASILVSMVCNPALLGNTGVRIGAAVAAALFAVHTQHAESVTWVAERKDLLSALFFLLAMIFYVRGHGNNDRSPSFLSFLCFVLAVMSKSMAVTLPLVLLVLDYFPLQRLGSPSRAWLRIVVVEKLHFYLVSMAIVMITLSSQYVDGVAQPSIPERLVISLSALQHYLLTFFIPLQLSPFYPVEIIPPGMNVSLWIFVMTSALAFGVAAHFWRRASIAFVLYLLVTLAPVIGIIKIGDQAFADRYVYLPLLGFYLLFGVLVAIAAEKFGRIRVLIPVVVLLSLLSFNTHNYKNVWQSDFTLWQHVVTKYPEKSAVAYNNFGNANFVSGNFEQAADSYRTGIAIDRHYIVFYSNLAKSYEKRGMAAEALAVHDEAIVNNPNLPVAYIQAGDAYLNHGQFQVALRMYGAVHDSDNTHAGALLGLGKVFLVTGDNQRAIHYLQQIAEDAAEIIDAKLILAQAIAPMDKDHALHILDELEKTYGKRDEFSAVRKLVN